MSANSPSNPATCICRICMSGFPLPIAICDDHPIVREGFRQLIEADGRHRVVRELDALGLRDIRIASSSVHPVHAELFSHHQARAAAVAYGLFSLLALTASVFFWELMGLL